MKEAPKRKIGMATLLTLTFGGLVALSTGVLLLVSLSNVLESTRNSLGSRLERLIEDAALQSEIFFEPMEAHARWLSREVAAGRVDPANKEQFQALLVGATSTLPQIEAVSFQYPEGHGFFYEPKLNKLQDVQWPREWQVQLNPNRSADQGGAANTGVWVLRPSVLDGTPATTFVSRVRTPEGEVGAVAVRVDLNPLSRSLASNASFRGYELVRFLLFNDRIVIGHPLLQTLGSASRPTIDDLGDPFLSELADGQRYPLNLVGDIPGVETFSLETPRGQRIFALTADQNREAGGKLTIGVHFDARTGSPELFRLVTVASIGTLLLIGSIIIAFILGRKAAAPMGQLADAALLIQENKLEEVAQLPTSSVKELSAATTAFNEMVGGLKERTKIRDLFGKYVPQDVAGLLLSDDSTAEPRNALATVLFLDIVGFSSISENMSPGDVVETMNAFFSDAVHLIEDEGGMVTQFQGDAILAVFNVPVAREKHAEAAVRAGISILKEIENQKYGGQSLRCRIGINTGPLVAGAIGAQDRLSYTVYGDAVNVAARLEQMNKEFDTQILVSGGTAELADQFAYKKIGNLPIRGRKEPVDVFTILEKT